MDHLHINSCGDIGHSVCSKTTSPSQQSPSTYASTKTPRIAGIRTVCTKYTVATLGCVTQGVKQSSLARCTVTTSAGKTFIPNRHSYMPLGWTKTETRVLFPSTENVSWTWAVISNGLPDAPYKVVTSNSNTVMDSPLLWIFS